VCPSRKRSFVVPRTTLGAGASGLKRVSPARGGLKTVTAETLAVLSALLSVGEGCGARTMLDDVSAGAEAVIDAGAYDPDVVDASRLGPDTGSDSPLDAIEDQRVDADPLAVCSTVAGSTVFFYDVPRGSGGWPQGPHTISAADVKFQSRTTTVGGLDLQVYAFPSHGGADNVRITAQSLTLTPGTYTQPFGWPAPTLDLTLGGKECVVESGVLKVDAVQITPGDYWSTVDSLTLTFYVDCTSFDTGPAVPVRGCLRT